MSATDGGGAEVVFAIPGELATKTGGSIYDARILEALRAAGRKVRHLPLHDGFPQPDTAALEHARAALGAVPPRQVLIVDGLAYGALCTEILAEVAAPMVVMLHHPLALEHGMPEGLARVLFERERANLVLAAHIVVPSPHTAQVLNERYNVDPARVSVALPGFTRPAPMRTGPASPPLILSVGILAARKGHDVLLRALSTLTDLPWHAEIVGREQDAQVAAALRAQSDALGLGERVRFAGCIEEEALAALYARASVFALATHYEGYGMVFSEALLHGLPIVSCRAGAVPDTVPADAGRLVEPGDADAFAAELRVLLSDEAARRRAAAAAERAGRALPGWDRAAAVMGAALDAAALMPAAR